MWRDIRLEPVSKTGHAAPAGYQMILFGSP